MNTPQTNPAKVAPAAPATAPDTKPAAGSGLGLSIEQRVVERHGGPLALDRAPLGGLRVVVTQARPAATDGGARV